MGVLDKFLDAIKLNDDIDDDLDMEDYPEDEDDSFLDDEPRPRKKFLEKFSAGRRSSVNDDLDDLDDYPQEERRTPVSRQTTTSTPVSSSRIRETAPKQEKITVRANVSSSKITPMRSSRRTSAGTQSVEVCVIRPTSMENTREIADTLLDNSTVILNLEGLDVELAQRIIDFTSGSCYSLGGTLQKVSSYIFVLGPSNVDITGDLQSIMGTQMPSVRAGF